MAFLRFIVPTLAVAGRLAAAASSCSVSATTTLSSQADATALAACTTFTGSIAIATSNTENIALNGITIIEGSLVADNVTQMLELSAPSLLSISDSFILNSLTMLTTLSFPDLTVVDTISWITLPALQGLDFTTGVSDVSSITIENTELASLDGLNFVTADTIVITENPYLEAITMQLGNVTTGLTISANGDDLAVSFPDLEWAANLTIGNASSLSIPSLASVNGSASFSGSSFTTLAAPNLTSVGDALTIEDCSSLTNISMTELTTVGGTLVVANNTDLVDIDFPSLKTVGGAVVIEGACASVLLPDISDVHGAFTLKCTGNVTKSCDTFKSLAGEDKTIHGTFTCEDTSSTSTSSGSSSSSSSGSSSSSSSSAAHAVLIPGATGLLGVVAAVFGLL